MALVEVWAPIVKEADLTPSLYRFIATNSHVPAFARLSVRDDAAEVVVSYVLFPELLTEEVLAYAVEHVHQTALELIQPIQSACGGRTLR